MEAVGTTVEVTERLTATAALSCMFLTQLTALVDAAVGLRALQHRDAQASAAARARRHLPGSNSQLRPAEEAAAFMRLASADFPMDITESLQMQRATIDQRQPSRGPSPGRPRRPGR